MNRQGIMALANELNSPPSEGRIVAILAELELFVSKDEQDQVQMYRSINDCRSGKITACQLAKRVEAYAKFRRII